MDIIDGHYRWTLSKDTIERIDIRPTQICEQPCRCADESVNIAETLQVSLQSLSLLRKHSLSCSVG